MSQDSYTVTEWKVAGIPEKVEGVCCDTVEFEGFYQPDIVVLECRSCGKKFENPRHCLLKAQNNPEYDGTVKTVTEEKVVKKEDNEVVE